mmetsp:Transcript_902/g.1328  ORF Transcript_902/g.1328 Transcript_902/m.1328 type:complete len:110 (+) Transcript_902:12-341(+)
MLYFINLILYHMGCLIASHHQQQNFAWSMKFIILLPTFNGFSVSVQKQYLLCSLYNTTIYTHANKHPRYTTPVMLAGAASGTITRSPFPYQAIPLLSTTCGAMFCVTQQ